MEIGIDIRAFESVHGEARPLGKLRASSEISVYRSRDYLAIKALCTHPRVFPAISDDYTSDPHKWEPPQDERVIYLLASSHKKIFGFGIFLPRTHVQYEAHFGFLPRAYGADAAHAFEQMLSWAWQNTTALRIVGEIVKANTLAIRFARRAGFEIYGLNKASYLRGGVLHDQVCLGISKPR